MMDISCNLGSGGMQLVKVLDMLCTQSADILF